MSAYPSPPPPRPHGGRSSFDNFLASVRRIGIWRTDDRWMGGVAAGIAHRLGVDPLLIRGAFVVAGLLGGIGFLIYGIAWLLLPEASDGRIHLQEASYGRVTAGFVGSVIMGVIGLIGMPPFIGVTGGWGSIVIAVMLVVALVVALPALASSPGNKPGGPGGMSGSPWAPPHDAGPGHPYAPPPAASPGGPGGTGTQGGTGTPVPGEASTGGPGAGSPGARGTSGPAGPSEPAGPGVGGPDMSRSPDGAASGAQAFSSGSGAEHGAYARASAPTSPLGAPPPAGPPPTPAPSRGRDSAAGMNSPWPPGGATGVPLVQPVPYSPAAAPIAPTAAPPAPVRPIRVRRRPPGGVVWAVVLAFALFIVAGVMLMDRQGAGPFRGGYAPALAIGGVLALLGIAIVGLSLAGRRTGGMTVCAILVMVLGLPTLAVVDATSRISWGPTVGHTVWDPSGASDVRGRYELGIGDAVLDLSDAVPMMGRREPVNFEVGIGQARLVLPPGVSTRITARVDIGDVRTTLPEGWKVTRGRGGKTEAAFGSNANVGGVGNAITAVSPEFIDTGQPTLDIRVNVSVGHLSIYQGDPS